MINHVGAPTKKERNGAIDFRSFIGLYCLYGGGNLIYVGETGLTTKGTIFQRLKQHRTGSMSGRWDRFSWFGRMSNKGSCQNEEAIALLEAIVIAIVNPGYNKQSGSFKGATQVFQMPHEKAEGDIETKLNRILQSAVIN